MKRITISMFIAAMCVFSVGAQASDSSYASTQKSLTIYSPNYLYSTSMSSAPANMNGMRIDTVRANYQFNRTNIPAGSQLEVYLCYGSGTSDCFNVTNHIGPINYFAGRSVTPPLTYYYRIVGRQSFSTVRGSGSVIVNASRP